MVLILSKEINQTRLERVVRSIFPKHVVKSNERKSTHLKSPYTGYCLELDVWIPQINLAFEFQDAYHYTSTWSSQIPSSVVRQKDEAKQQLAREVGETLVLVPCWWDGDAKSLAAMIHFHRPDLCRPRSLSLSSNYFPLLAPLNPPLDMFKYGHVPEVGELMLASFPLNSQFIQSISLSNPWWIGEKYDGVRVCWNPARSTLYSRTGGEVILPEVFENNFPDCFLDGELWLGRGNFPDTQRIIQSGNSPLLPYLRVIGFDFPEKEFQKKPFEVRFENLLMNIKFNHPFVNVAHRMKSTTSVHVTRIAKEILEEGGEGVVLRKPKSPYETGRSPFLLKLKAARGDREAVVIQSNAKSYVLKLPDDTTFKVYAHNFKYNIKPKPGDIVTFSYDNYSQRAIPVKPRIYRIRTDIEWHDVVSNYYNEISSNPLSLNEPSQKVTEYMTHPHGYWTSEKGKNMRAFFEKYAIQNQLDPLSPHSWYTLPRKSIESLPGARTILAHYGGRLVDALMSLFPDIGLERGKFDVLPNNFWHDVNNRRKIFDKFAKSKGFDPLIPENWYPICKSDMLHMKSAKSIFRYVNTSLMQALITIYPEVEFIESNFVTLPSDYWNSEVNRKKFFINYAKKRQFNPNQEQWYSVDKKDLLNFKGAASVLAFYGGGVVKALTSLFPHLDQRKFDLISKNHWSSAENQRRWFVSFAAERNFDPYIPENWYNLSRYDIYAVKGGKSVLSFHRGNLHEALLYLFPEINFEEHNFLSLPVNYWNDETHKRSFFVNFAKDYSFDPKVADNWYRISNEQVAARVGSKAVIGENTNFSKSLMELFPDVSFDKRKFGTNPYNYWQNTANRRHFFENIATSHGVKSNLPEFWYTLPLEKILGTKGASSVLSYHRGSVVEALTYLFHELDWDIERLKGKPLSADEVGR